MPRPRVRQLRLVFRESARPELGGAVFAGGPPGAAVPSSPSPAAGGRPGASVPSSRSPAAADPPEATVPGALVVAIFGPTGIGKTEVGIEVAEQLGAGQIISCDSMQIYRGFPILTNQPDAEQQSRVHHGLMGVADPEDEWSAARYAEEAKPLIGSELAQRGLALLVGGTGLYLRAALAPLDIPPVHNPQLRRQLEEEGRRDGVESLHRRLAEVDPEAASLVDPCNPRRLARALEVALISGPGAWKRRDDLWNPPFVYPTLVVGLTAERAWLHERINQRSRAMLDGGAIEEVRRHRSRAGKGGYGAPSTPVGVTKAIGYREIEAFLEGRIARPELQDRLAAATRRYARRQTTWMRKIKGVVMIDASTRSVEQLALEVVGLVKRARREA